MSLWGVHVGFAVATTAIVLLLVVPGYRYRWLVFAASALWAIIPDFHHLFGFAPLLQRYWKAVLHESAVADVFWLHRVIDRLDPGDEVLYSAAMWAMLAAVLLATELAIRWRTREA